MITYISDTAFRLDGELVDTLALAHDYRSKRTGANIHRIDSAMTRIVSTYRAWATGHYPMADTEASVRAGLADLKAIR